MIPCLVQAYHTFLNYRKADWEFFTSCVEDVLSSISVPPFPNIDSAVDEFTRTLLAAIKSHIPAGYVCGYSSPFLLRFGDWWGSGPDLDLISSPPIVHDENQGIYSRDQRQGSGAFLYTMEVRSGIHRPAHLPSKLWKVVHASATRTLMFLLIMRLSLPPGTLIPSPREQVDLLVAHYTSISRLPHNRDHRQSSGGFTRLESTFNSPTIYPRDSRKPCQVGQSILRQRSRWSLLSPYEPPWSTCTAGLGWHLQHVNQARDTDLLIPRDGHILGVSV